MNYFINYDLLDFFGGEKIRKILKYNIDCINIIFLIDTEKKYHNINEIVIIKDKVDEFTFNWSYGEVKFKNIKLNEYSFPKEEKYYYDLDFKVVGCEKIKKKVDSDFIKKLNNYYGCGNEELFINYVRINKNNEPNKEFFVRKDNTNNIITLENINKKSIIQGDLNYYLASDSIDPITFKKSKIIEKIYIEEKFDKFKDKIKDDFKNNYIDIYDLIHEYEKIYYENNKYKI